LDWIESSPIRRRRRKKIVESSSYPVPVTVYLDKGPGSIWIEDKEFHWIDSNKAEWYFPGTLVEAATTGRPGSIWIEGDDFHYIDAYGDDRKVYGPVGSTQSARPSIWIEATSSLFSWITELLAKNVSGHVDVVHSDTHGDTTHNDHGDVAHADITHVDSHDDWHSDIPHSDSHSDTHSDTHVDEHTDHQDGFSQPDHYDEHTDYHDDSHSDEVHSDVNHTDDHGDTTHGDVPHTDTHTDHNDSAHVDTHGDVVHTDLPIYVGLT
jgi:hypothetical protein